MNQDQQKIIVHEIARHQSRIRGLVRCLLVRRDDVEDMLQEVNAVLWEKGGEFKSDTDFWAWASQIVRFKVLNYLRKTKRDFLIFDDQLLEQIADLTLTRLEELEDRRMALERCLQKLPAAQRQLIDLRYSTGESLDQMSVMLKRPVGSIRQTLFRIRAVLQQCIETQLRNEVEPV
jgi:RNA polymerase sigma-70 factor (ECF subfamily)